MSSIGVTNKRLFEVGNVYIPEAQRLMTQPLSLREDSSQTILVPFS